MTDILLKAGEVAKQLGIGKHAVRRMLPPVVLGPKTIRYRQSDVTAIINGGRLMDRISPVDVPAFDGICHRGRI